MAKLSLEMPLAEADKELIFRTATASLPLWHAAEIAAGMTDGELANALQAVLGIFGGSSGPGRPDVSFTGSGLRIWGGWHFVNHSSEKPLFAGKATLAMARIVYNIADPDKKQMELF